MIFVNPLVLIGLVVAALPILVHLFNFRKPKKLDYSSLALLQSLQRTTMQRLRLRNWLLLILRTLALCALIIVFARPSLVGSSATQFLGKANVSMVIAIDASLSMMQRDTEGTRFEQAKSVAQSIINASDPGDEIFIMQSNTPLLDPVSSLDDLSPMDQTQSATATIRSAAELISERGTHFNQIVYYIGDLQRSTLSDSLETKIGESVQVFLVPVGHSDIRPNVSIESVQVTSRIVDQGSPIEVESIIVNHGETLINNHAVSLYLNRTHVAQTTASLPPNIPVSVLLRGTTSTRGWIEGSVVTEDDPFAYDNERHFSLNIPEERTILLIHGSTAETRHVELALSLADASSGLLTRVIGQRDLVAAPLSEFSAIFLIGPDELSSGEILKLKQYVENGGGMLVFPGLDQAPINSLLSEMNAGQGDMQASEASILSADFEHPLFEGVFEVSDQVQRLEAIRVHRFFRYIPNTAIEQTLITLVGGNPLLQEIQYEQGRIFFLTVAPEVSWSDLPVRGLFVPLIYRAAHYLSASGSVQGQHLTVGESSTLRIPSVQGTVTIQMPDGSEYIPKQRQVFGARMIDLEIETTGIGKVFVDNKAMHYVSVGLDPTESRLAFMSPTEASQTLAQTLGTRVDLLEIESQHEIGDAMRVARVGVELWRHFLVLGLLLLIAEMILASRWKNH